MIWVLSWPELFVIFVNNEVFYINNIISFGKQMAQKCNGPPEPMNPTKYKQQQQD